MQECNFTVEIAAQNGLGVGHENVMYEGLLVPAMKRLFLLVILVASVSDTINSSPLHFSRMIQRITGKNALIYFIGYGCYCGKEGKGKPRDKTDMCCYNHDCCYDSLYMQKCHPLIDHYTFTIVNDDVFCENGEKSGCPTRVCECDREASLCFRKASRTYNKSLHHYPDLWCRENPPKCPPGKGTMHEGLWKKKTLMLKKNFGALTKQKGTGGKGI
ncbi:basic phospholipase A2-like [Eublepharis macularius]|uniref:Phospholipase A2 n=1 Tax=Eublepharis macularius TaxID=481883 RepID=A0AA97KLL3_EUBMA|nr:basic phospholipase A2-like [Eublepharis macularius]